MKKFTDKINESVESGIKTADEFFDSANIGISSNTEYMYCKKDVVKKAIEFAKLHVEAALKAASEEADYITDGQEHITDVWIDKDSILKSYPLDNIK